MIPAMETQQKEYTVTVYTENQIGLLAQIANAFTRRSLSIWSLVAGPTATKGIHSIDIVTCGPEKKVSECASQIEKRVDVVSVTYAATHTMKTINQ